MGGPGSGRKAADGTNRPTQWDPEIAAELLLRLSTGTHGSTLRAIIADDPTMPQEMVVYAWSRGENGAPASFQLDYAKARIAQADHLAEGTLDIAEMMDDTARESIELALEGAGDELSPQERRQLERMARKRSIEASKEIIKTRRWLASKLGAKRWGDRLNLAVSDPDGGPAKIDFTNLTDEQLEELEKMRSKLAGESE